MLLAEGVLKGSCRQWLLAVCPSSTKFMWSGYMLILCIGHCQGRVPPKHSQWVSSWANDSQGHPI